MTDNDRCVFCEIVRQPPGGEAIAFDQDVYMFAPLNPVTPGHRLFVPYEHVEDAASYPDTTARVMRAAAGYAAHSRETITTWPEVPGIGLSYAQDFNLITSAGAAASQTIRHLHVHYVPRRPGDGLALPWTEHAAELAEYQALFELQWNRSIEADELWRAEDPEARKNIRPDLGELLGWLIERGNR